eukprot:756749-Hanusia_phi.AAC.7
MTILQPPRHSQQEPALNRHPHVLLLPQQVGQDNDEASSNRKALSLFEPCDELGQEAGPRELGLTRAVAG